MEILNKKVFKKSESFKDFENLKSLSYEHTLKKIFQIYEKNQIYLKEKFDHHFISILNKSISDLKNKQKNPYMFDLKKNTLMEINSYSNDMDVMKYLIHRYRYEIFPEKKIIDEFPPLLQIEPSSICNFRCVFCFETDKTFTNKKNGFMGTMELETFQKIIDQIHGKIEFLTLASRGEPLVSKNFVKMLEYCKGKFLNLKINTNASLLDEKKSHAILSNDVKTVVFSADAANDELYSKLRVNGKLETTLRNIKKFTEIKKKHYSNKKIITRVSGVKFSKDQSFDEMLKLWGSLVDQVAFVDYNPWENSYEKESNHISKPCSDLWRRMFVWWDGKVNPCDVDYKSILTVGNFNSLNISEAWNSQAYNKMRDLHLNNKRSSLTPCKSCTVI